MLIMRVPRWSTPLAFRNPDGASFGPSKKLNSFDF